jgi:hypothetical protein
MPAMRCLLDCCRGLVVVGSPKTLSSDAIWRAWVRWVRDHGVYQTPSALPLCSWESPDEEFVSNLDVSDLRPIDERGTGLSSASLHPHLALALSCPRDPTLLKRLSETCTT